MGKPLTTIATLLSLIFVSAAPIHADQTGGGMIVPVQQKSWSTLNDRRYDQRRRLLPDRCLQHIQTYYGMQRLFGQRCLERRYDHLHSLPARCTVRIYTYDGPRGGFDPFCLRTQGFRSDRHR